MGALSWCNQGEVDGGLLVADLNEVLIRQHGAISKLISHALLCFVFSAAFIGPVLEMEAK